MAVVLSNNATSLLAGAITAGSTTLSIENADASKFPNPIVGDWFPLTIVDASGNMEILKATKREGAIITVSRAQEGTTAKAFAAGARIDLRLTVAASFEVTPSAMETAEWNHDGLSSEGSRFFWFDTVARKLKRFSWSALVSLLNQSLSFVKINGGGNITGSLSTTGTIMLRRNDWQEILFQNGDGSQWEVSIKKEDNNNLIIQRRQGGSVRLQDNGIVSSGHVFTGGGNSRLETNGNVVGSIWNNWGASDSYSAISARIEQRAREFADDRANAVRGEVWWRCRDYMLGEHIPVGGYAFLRAANGAKVPTAGTIGGNSLGWSNVNHDYIGPINYGTWQLCGWIKGSNFGEDQTSLWKRIG
ncbi:hypothetical protein ABE527_18540 [Brucella sp. TWI432]